MSKRECQLAIFKIFLGICVYMHLPQVLTIREADSIIGTCNLCDLQNTCFVALSKVPTPWKIVHSLIVFDLFAVNDSKFDWKEACIRREEQYHMWSNHERAMDTYQFREGLFAAVDCVHFMKVRVRSRQSKENAKATRRTNELHCFLCNCSH